MQVLIFFNKIKRQLSGVLGFNKDKEPQYKNLVLCNLIKFLKLQHFILEIKNYHNIIMKEKLLPK